MRTLQETREFLLKIPYINNGGCGIAALSMFLASQNENTQVIYMYRNYSESSYKNNKRVLETGEGNAEAAEHVALLLENGVIIDCEKEVDINDYQYSNTTTDINFIINSIENGSWNPFFDRNKYLPKIEKFINFQILKREKKSIFSNSFKRFTNKFKLL